MTSQLLWRTEGGKRLVADTPCLRLVVEAAGGRATFRLLDRPEHAGMREPVGFASGVAADIRAAMGAAERMREWFELPADAVPRA